MLVYCKDLPVVLSYDCQQLCRLQRTGLTMISLSLVLAVIIVYNLSGCCAGDNSTTASNLAQNISRVGDSSRNMAGHRAVASESPLNPFSEPLAAILADDKALQRAKLRAQELGLLDQRNLVSVFVCRHMMLDTLIDAAITEAVHSPKQVVILGAGMDTRYSRLGGDGNVRLWYEVDRQEIIDLKEELLREAAQETFAGRTVKRIAVDFVSGVETLVPKLVEAGFRVDAPAIFVLEGLVYYLPTKSVKDLLSILPTVPNSRILMTVIPARLRRNMERRSTNPEWDSMWKTDWSELKRAKALPKHYKVVLEMNVGTSSARKLGLGVTVPSRPWKERWEFPAERVVELVAV